MLKITESPRDAMQAIKTFIPTTEKLKYINSLFDIGFDTIDLGSFVSPYAVPQMKDTAEILDKIDKKNSKISVLVGASKYAERLAEYDVVDYINYPFGISPKFQKKNLGAGMEKSQRTIDEIINVCEKANKKPIITIATAFGNPYDNDWGVDLLMEWIELLANKGLNFIPLADTTASADVHTVGLVMTNVIEEFPEIEFNMHLHTNPDETEAKLVEAFNAGCRNFDTVFNGRGGCPMSGKELVANVETIYFYEWMKKNKLPHKLNEDALYKSQKIISEIFDNLNI